MPNVRSELKTPATKLFWDIFIQPSIRLFDLGKNKTTILMDKRSILCHSMGNASIQIYVLPPINYFFNGDKSSVFVEKINPQAPIYLIGFKLIEPNPSIYLVKSELEFSSKSLMLSIPLKINTNIIFHNIYEITSNTYNV